MYYQKEVCIVQYSKFYIDSVIGLMQDGKSLEDYAKVKEPIERVWKILDRISKGKSNMRDVYLLRTIAEQIKKI